MNKTIITVPYPSKAEMDYNQNGLVLPKDPKNLELLLRDVHQKGFLDLELLYQLKEKEKVKDVEKEIADRIANTLEEATPMFQRVFERCLASYRLIQSTYSDQRKTPSPIKEMGLL